MLIANALLLITKFFASLLPQSLAVLLNYDFLVVFLVPYLSLHLTEVINEVHEYLRPEALPARVHELIVQACLVFMKASPVLLELASPLVQLLQVKQMLVALSLVHLIQLLLVHVTRSVYLCRYMLRLVYFVPHEGATVEVHLG